jgi:hypothetical protein
LLAASIVHSRSTACGTFVLYCFRYSHPMAELVQLVTILGLAVCLGMIYLRAKAAKTRSPSSAKQRLKTAHVLLIALAVWLVVSFNLQHLNRTLGGQPAGEQSTWERIVRFLAGRD